jgi:CHAD domain-containing protein
MPYIIDLKLPLDQAVLSVASEQAEQAITALREGDSATLDDRVHDARKCVKKLRALLRLVRPGLAKSSYRSLNLTLRDAARLLSSTRDRAALLEALSKLRSQTGTSQAPATDFDRIEQLLRGGDEQATAGSQQAALRDAREMLTGVAERFKRDGLGDVDAETLIAGLRRTYRMGRLQSVVVTTEESAHEFHEWRKHTKDAWYHVRLLSGAWPGALDALAGELAVLSELLGDDHDLYVLLEAVTAAAGASDLPDLPAFRSRVSQRVTELRTASTALGARIYAEPASSFAQRFAAYLRAAGT